MPEISRFYGIVIKLYFDDHDPPHFHAEYAECEALVSVKTMAVIAGNLPPRALGLVMEWTSMHQKELLAAWSKAKNLEPVEKIEPLL